MTQGVDPAVRVLPQAELAVLLESRRSKGQKIVFTNGVFDLIHTGHLRYLAEARALGDLLVVAVNSDDSVRRLKGPKRPIISERERAKILAALEVVDYVTSFNEDTPFNVINLLQPDVLVKGGDYTPDTVVGKDIVEARGGRVVCIPLVVGKSSSNVIQRVLDADEVAKKFKESQQGESRGAS
ncbi:MAG: D-glycero-beta-D-manno-heptose 1-phosphate adenylyltransferase [Candidatus Sumerlaeaceae bacterium]|nr:D-glycero-beta-D-manno-heptose 1-phosphate adenylyltransferase [Candidatus Sumerlaeaceae bacterium]